MFFEQELAELGTDDVVMPSIRCSDLVDLSCDDRCDWETAFSTAHEFSDTELLQHLSYHPVFLKVVDTEHSLIDFVHEAKFLSYSTENSQRPHGEEDTASVHTCSVIGCDQGFPDARPNGWTLDVSNTGPVCSKHDLRIRRWKKLWCKKTSNPRTGPVYEAGLLDNLWTPDELKADAACRCEIRPMGVTMTTENLRLQYKGVELHLQRENGSHLWTIPTLNLHQDLRQESQSTHLDFAICADGVHSSATTAKLHGQFRSDVLRAMLEAENITCNMVLFHCTTCNTRFPTFHPKFQPPSELKCLSTCPIEVDTWTEPAEADIPVNSLMAPYCRGECKRCATQQAQVLEEMKADPLQRKKVVVFSASNRQDPLDGYPGLRKGLPELNFESETPLRQLVEHHHAELQPNAHTA